MNGSIVEGGGRTSSFLMSGDFNATNFGGYVT